MHRASYGRTFIKELELWFILLTYWLTDVLLYFTFSERLYYHKELFSERNDNVFIYISLEGIDYLRDYVEVCFVSVTERELHTAVLKAIQKMRKVTPKRNFTEAVEVQISIRDVDLRKPENRIRARIKLPYPVAEKDKIVFFADDSHVPALRALQNKENITVIDRAKLEEFGSNIRQFKKIARRNRIFLSSASLMSLVGRYFGKILSPRNKMPIPVGITDDVASRIDEARRTVSVRLHKSPTIHAKVGHINMKDEELAENIVSFIMSIKNKLPKGWRNIRSIYIKTTMGPPIRVDISPKKKAG